MPKKATPASVPLSKLAGKTVTLAGKFRGSFADRLPEYLRAVGGKLAGSLDAATDYLVLGESGTATAEGKAKRLNDKKSASIEILTQTAFAALLVPTREEAVALLRGGSKRLPAWNFVADFVAAGLPDLTNLDLRGVDLSRASLSGVALDGSDLRDANLSGAEVSLRQCRLEGVKLDKTELGHLRECQAAGVDFTAACWEWPVCLAGTDCSKAHFGDAHFARADLRGARFDGADLSQTLLAEAQLDGASLVGTNLAGVDLVEASLASADLRRCNLRGANLSRADLSNANVEGADFTGANLISARLEGVDLEKAKGAAAAPTRPAGRIGPAVKKMIDAGEEGNRFYTSATVRQGDEDVCVWFTLDRWSTIRAAAHDTRGGAFLAHDSTQVPAERFFAIAQKWLQATFDPTSVVVKGTKCLVPNKELKQLALEAWCEIFGVPVPTAAEIRKLKRTRPG